MADLTELTTREMNRLVTEFQLGIRLEDSLVPASAARDQFAASIADDLAAMAGRGQTLKIPNDLDDGWAPDPSKFNPPYTGPRWDSEQQKLVPRDE